MKTLSHILKTKKNNITQKSNIVKGEDGQTLVEFLFLFVILISLSMGFVFSINSYISKRWLEMVKIITVSDPAKAAASPISLP